jgi:hypothetical protein
MGGKVMLKVLIADDSSAIYQIFAVSERIADSKTGAAFAFEVGPVKQAGLRDG